MIRFDMLVFACILIGTLQLAPLGSNMACLDETKCAKPNNSGWLKGTLNFLRLDTFPLVNFTVHCDVWSLDYGADVHVFDHSWFLNYQESSRSTDFKKSF